METNTYTVQSSLGGKLRPVQNVTDISAVFPPREVVTVFDPDGNVVYYGACGKASSHIRKALAKVPA